MPAIIRLRIQEEKSNLIMEFSGIISPKKKLRAGISILVVEHSVSNHLGNKPILQNIILELVRCEKGPALSLNLAQSNLITPNVG